MYRGVPIGTLSAGPDGAPSSEFELHPNADWARELIERASDVTRHLGYLGSVDDAGDARGAAVVRQLRTLEGELSVVDSTGLPRPDLRVRLDSHPRLPGRIFVIILPLVEPDGEAGVPARAPLAPDGKGSHARLMPNEH